MQHQLLQLLQPSLLRRLRDSDSCQLAAVTAWKALISIAYFADHTNLSAQGFYYVVPSEHLGYDWSRSAEQQLGRTINYFTQGVCITAVEIDCISGNSRVLGDSTRRSTSGRSRASA